MCSAESCGFCRFLSHLISVGVYRFVFAVLLMLNITLAFVWMGQSMDIRNETPFRFASEVWPVAEFAMGLLLVFVTMFGCFSNAFRGNPVHTQNVYRFLAGAVGGLALVVGAVFIVAASDKSTVGGMIEYGWNNVFHDELAQDHIRAAQAQYHCCGFFTQEKDRAVAPCPVGARTGCQDPLVDEYTRLMTQMGSWLIYGVIVCLLTVAWLYCYEEGYYHEMMKKGRDVYRDDDLPFFGEDAAEPQVPLGARRMLNEFAGLYKPSQDDDLAGAGREGDDDDLDTGVFVRLHKGDGAAV